MLRRRAAEPAPARRSVRGEGGHAEGDWCPQWLRGLRCGPRADETRAGARDVPTTPANAITVSRAPLQPGDVIALAPNVISVKHWDRLMGGLLYATQPRVDWARLLRRRFSVDVLECPKCHGRLRVVAVFTEREPIQRILSHLGLPTEAPALARARDPTDDALDDESSAQLTLGIA